MKSGLYRNTESVLGRKLHVLSCRLGEDVHVSIYGGDRAHIGAVSILSENGEIQTVCFPGHRDDAVSVLWCERLKEFGVHAAVVEAGIHYNELSKEGIAAVLAACDGLWNDFRQAFLEEHPEIGGIYL